MSEATTLSTELGPAEITLTVRGRFDGSTVGLVRAAVHAVIEDSTADLRIDVSDISWIDVPALAVIADAHRRLRAQGRRVELRGANDRIRRVLAVTGLSRVIPVHRSDPHLVA